MEQTATELERRYGYNTVSTGIAAILLNYSRETIRKMCESGELDSERHRIAGHYKIYVTGLSEKLDKPLAEVYEKIENPKKLIVRRVKKA